MLDANPKGEVMEGKKKQVALWLPEDDVAAIDQIAAKQLRSRNNLIRLVIRAYVDTMEPIRVPERADEAGNAA